MDNEIEIESSFSLPELDFSDPPAGSDRRTFMVRSAMATAIAALGGVPNPLWAQSQAGPPLGSQGVDPNLQVVKNSKGPVMTLVDEFYKVGPGPSSSHTIGPMRITYDFYQRAIKLPADQLARATALKVHLFGSLSATGKGHGTERAALAGLIGHEPATIDPVAVLDKMAAEPDKVYPVKLGPKTIDVSLKDIIYDATKGDFHHPNTMIAKLMAGDKVLMEQEYYSVGGGFIEWKGYTPPKKNPRNIPIRR
ncbi:serine dehydratase beta chain [Sphingomonas sp. HDW15A]|uniref:serine dehydratase beta chain n=1 Tax=Sphingomonas sp. HDW15A TaxID=2714942 RepID=UPI0019CF8057|nr:serine dehydratase beta chain [Sphingomonas sp. HDW15A]